MDFNISFEKTPVKRRNNEEFVPSSDGKRRKFSTKNCQECRICSDDVFEVSLT